MSDDTGTVRISLGYKLRFVLITELQCAGVSQAELARRIGKTEKHVSQALSARAGLSADLADEMLRAIGREWTVGTAVAFGEPATEDWRLQRHATENFLTNG